MTAPIELKPCPFCGGEARLDQRVTQSLWNSGDAVFSHAACDDCDISGQDFCDDPDGEEAIEWWNRRAQPASAPEESIVDAFTRENPELMAAATAELEAEIEAYQAGVNGLVEALQEIVKQYPNPDLSHVDYRVHACKHAEQALAGHSTNQPLDPLPIESQGGHCD